MRAMEPIREKKQVHKLLDYYRKQGHARNRVLIAMSVHSALRISDTLQLKVEDVYDLKKKRVKLHIELTEGKTKKRKVVELHPTVVAALKSYLPEAVNSKFLFPSTRKDSKSEHLSRVQAHRIIRAAGEAVGTEETISCHSLRKTFGYHAWKDGVSPAILMEIYNHSSLAITRRYLGVAQSDMNEVYQRLSF